MNSQSKHTRVINTLTGPLEKRVLNYLASRMPNWVTSDLMTIVGVIGSVIIFVGYSLTNYSPHVSMARKFGFCIELVWGQS